MKQLLNNHKTVLTVIVSIISLLLFSCKKQEKVIPDPPYIVILDIKGSTVTDTLEFLKDGRVIAKSNSANGNFEASTHISITEKTATVQVRRKGHTEIIATREIFPVSFNQSINIYYDGDKTYEKAVNVNIKGYAQTGTLEFVMDGRVIGTATDTKFPGNLSIGIEPGKNRQIQIRRTGETTVLFTKEILADQNKLDLTIFYDGIKVLDKIEINKPANPANMLISFAFSSTVNVYSGPTDLLIHTVDGDIDTPTDIRTELPVDGSFCKTIELPPLSTGINYGFKLVKRGTATDLPYNLTDEVRPIKPVSGFKSIIYAPGTTAILVVNDQKSVATVGPVSRRGTTFTITSTDIAQYFK